MTEDDPIILRQAASKPVIATNSTRADAVRILHRAFGDDLMMRWLLRPDHLFEPALHRLIDQLIGALTIPLGHTYLAHAPGIDGGAVAAWQPPDVAGQPMGLLDTLRLLPDMVRVAGFGRLPRLLAAMDALDKNHPKHEPHFYLYFLGVDPKFQGRGLGSLILEASLAPIDGMGLPCYLENSKPRNTPLYTRYGFVAGTEFRARPDAPPLLPMWRKAR
jgi:ribosomal protein S18 acetylase RimI-like enzyme